MENNRISRLALLRGALAVTAGLLVPAALASPAASADEWVRIGQREVDRKSDKDTFELDGENFRRLRFRVSDSDVRIHDIVVHFENGERFRPAARALYAEDKRSRVIDLPGKSRSIDKVVFKYGNLPGGGKAEVTLYGRR